MAAQSNPFQQEVKIDLPVPETSMLSLGRYLASSYNSFGFKHPTISAKLGKLTKTGKSMFATFTLTEGTKTLTIKGILSKDSDGNYKKPFVFIDGVDYDITITQ